MKNSSPLFKIVLVALFLFVSHTTANAQTTWISANHGTIDANINCLMPFNGKLYAGGGSGGLYATDTATINWSQVTSLGNYIINGMYANGNDFFVATYGNGVYHSSDNTATWVQADTGFLQGNTYSNCFFMFNDSLFVGNNDGGYYSADTGKHWKPIATLGSQIIYDYAVWKNIPFSGSGYGIHISLDSGLTWAYANNGLANGSVRHLAVSGNRVLCAVYQHSIYATTDTGSNWVASSTGIPSGDNITALFADGNTVYAGTDNDGVYRSIDNGVNWTSYNQGHTFSSVVSCFGISNGKLYAGTSLEGVLVVDKLTGIKPVASEAIQLYPNPTNGLLAISGYTPQTKIEVVDEIGRIILLASPKNNPIQTLDIGTLATGMYLVKFTDPDGKVCGKKVCEGLMP